MTSLSDEEIVDIISKLINCEGSEEEQDKLLLTLKECVPFHGEIIKEIYWTNNNLLPIEVFLKAKSIYKPIVLGP